MFSGLATLVYATLLRRVRAQTAGILTFLEPVAAILLAAALLDEPLPAGIVAGGALVARRRGSLSSGWSPPTRPAADAASRIRAAVTDAAPPDRNLALELVRVTEAAAMGAARWVGRGDKNAADQAAVDAMRLCSPPSACGASS